MTHVKESEYLAAQTDLPPFNYAYLFNIINVFRVWLMTGLCLFVYSFCLVDSSFYIPVVFLI